MGTPLKTNLVVTVVGKALEKGVGLGKVQLQKIIYFLQETAVPAGYKYSIYHYGPYSFDLATDLDTLDSLKILKIAPDPDGHGYCISTGKFSNEYFDKNDSLINPYDQQINFVLENFIKCDASEIELKATIHYVYKNQKNKGAADKVATTSMVKKLKPKFTVEEISSAYDELNSVMPLR